MTKTKMEKFFSDAYRHFVLQGNLKAVDKDGRCRYKMPDGRKCVIGLQIPDEMYSTIIEGLSITDWKYEGGECENLLTFFDIDKEDDDTWRFLGELQELHDSYFEKKDTWIGFAKKWNLRVPRK